MPNARLVTCFKTTLEDKPGALLAMSKDLKSKNLALRALFGVGEKPGQAELLWIPKNADKFRDVCKSANITAEEETGIFLKGTDKTGALVKALDAVAKKGVNIAAVYAIASSGNYGSLIRFAAADVQKAAKALCAK